MKLKLWVHEPLPKGVGYPCVFDVPDVIGHQLLFAQADLDRAERAVVTWLCGEGHIEPEWDILKFGLDDANDPDHH